MKYRATKVGIYTKLGRIEVGEVFEAENFKGSWAEPVEEPKPKPKPASTKKSKKKSSKKKA